MRQTLAHYLNLETKAQELEYKAKQVSRLYYLQRSMTGTMLAGLTNPEWQTACDPFNSVCQIIADENTLYAKAERARKRYALLLEEYTKEDLHRFKTALKHDLISPELQALYDYIQEIEFYLDAHWVASKKQMMIEYEEQRKLEWERMASAVDDLFKELGVSV